jgi:protein-S-isoprenylcysteine O-methyltransferase Ste14
MLGLAVFALGLVGLVVALINFRDTPPDQPAVKGLYRVSRNPQAVAFFLANYAICIAIGSWIAAIMLALAQLFAHFRIVAEEQSCLRQYGASYRGYMQRVPRYFLFF